jgi:hypothetical protein
MRSLYALVWRNLTAHKLRSVPAALVGLMIAPFICAGAAWLPARSVLRSPVIETIAASAE